MTGIIKVKGIVYGVGVNDADYKVGGCPFYNTWVEMLRRCLSVREKARHKTYREAISCEEWLTFSKFKAWMEMQPWQGNDLDKDILVVGNKMYSPETCVFVPSYINTLLVKGDAIRGNWPLGVSLLKDQLSLGRKKVFRASIKDKRGASIQKNLGHFETSAEAHKAWQLAKYDVMSRRLDEYSLDECFNPVVASAIKTRAILLKLDAALGKETIFI